LRLRLTVRLAALLLGASALAPHAHADLDPGPRILSSIRLGDRLKVTLALGTQVTEADLEAASRTLIQRFGPQGVRRFELWARDARGRLVPAASLVPPPPPVPRRQQAFPGAGPIVRRFGPSFDAPGATTGFLTGKTVYVSAGHGWVYSSSSNSWSTQRGNTWDIVEDFSNAEAVNIYLIRYLMNAGANVFTVREADLQEAMVIVDDSDPGYHETGPGFRPSASPGFASGRAPYTGEDNPMLLGTTREVLTASTETSTARWVPHFPLAGEYAVYVAYAAALDRAPDAHYVVRHPGGETHFRVDQRRHGQTWVPLGTFYFDAGSDPQRGAVELRNDSAQPGTVLSLDAVRFGGGMGDVVRGSGVSGKRRWEEGARYYAQFSGAPASVYHYTTRGDGSDDVGTRSRYAAWQHEAGEDAVFISWHTNAPAPGRGTSTYVYGPNPPDGTYNFTGVAGSDRLARLVHDEIVGDIRAAWDPSWRDLGVFSAYFGELNPAHNSEMPSALVEVAFHSTEADAQALKEPRFRQLVARAMYQGIARYFAERDRIPVKLLPEPPSHLALRQEGPDRVRVSWRAPADEPAAGDPPLGYRVYQSRDGRAWDNGAAAPGTSFLLRGLAPGERIYVRVTSVNSGGESFPGPTLGVRVAAAGRAPLLLVHAFDRLDAKALVPEVTPGLGTVLRMFPSRMNRFNHVVEHGEAAHRAGISFDSAQSAAVASGEVDLSAYQAVDWMAGCESTKDESFSSEEQVRVRAFAQSGGALLVSGSEIAWDLDPRGTAADQAFLSEVLSARYAGDETVARRIVAEGVMSDLSPLDIDDGSLGTYAVRNPDFLEASGLAQVVWRFEGTRNVAGILVPGRVVYLSVPIEALHPASDREALYGRALALLGIEEPQVPDGGLESDGGSWPGDGGTMPGDGGIAPGDGGTMPEDGGTVPGDGGTPPGDAGNSPADGGTGADGGNSLSPAGGCGCSQPGGSPGALLGLLAWGFARSRRRERH
jgi:hypothetical protein